MLGAQPAPPATPCPTGHRHQADPPCQAWIVALHKDLEGGPGQPPPPPRQQGNRELKSQLCLGDVGSPTLGGGGAETEGATACTMLVGGQQGTWGQQMSLVFW